MNDNEIVILKDVSYKKNGQKILNGITLKVLKGDKVVLIGPSGSGKTTVLKMIAGLIEPTSGSINMPKCSKSNNTNVRLVFQDNILFPWWNIRKNISIAMHSKSIDETKLRDMLEALDLQDNILRKMPSKISGGELRRISVLICLLADPNLVLLDEPTTSLDFKNKEGIHALLTKYLAEYSATLLLVTHDIEEAIHMGDNIICLNNGCLGETIVNRKRYDREDDKWYSEIKNKIKGQYC